MRQLERNVLLNVLDRKWREHLYEMDYLKEGIGLRGDGAARSRGRVPARGLRHVHRHARGHQGGVRRVPVQRAVEAAPAPAVAPVDAPEGLAEFAAAAAAGAQERGAGAVATKERTALRAKGIDDSAPPLTYTGPSEDGGGAGQAATAAASPRVGGGSRRGAPRGRRKTRAAADAKAPRGANRSAARPRASCRDDARCARPARAPDRPRCTWRTPRQRHLGVLLRCRRPAAAPGATPRAPSGDAARQAIHRSSDPAITTVRSWANGRRRSMTSSTLRSAASANAAAAPGRCRLGRPGAGAGGSQRGAVPRHGGRAGAIARGAARSRRRGGRPRRCRSDVDGETAVMRALQRSDGSRRPAGESQTC